MRIDLVALTCLGLNVGGACGTDLEPSREPLGTTTSPADGGGGSDATSPGETPADGSADAPSANGWPCDVRAVLEAYCARCHTGETYAIWYTTPNDWRTPVGGGQTLGQFAVTRMRDTTNPMPPAYDSGPKPMPAEIDVVAAWVAAGMPDGTCGPLTPPPR
jgi:hypothetical protein